MSYFMLCKILNFRENKKTFSLNEQVKILNSYKNELKKRMKRNKDVLKKLEL